MIVAVDGPVAAGKGTLARRLAQHFGFAYLDTGSLYRATASKSLRAGLEPAQSAQTLTPGDLAAGDLRTEAVGQMASKVAAMPAVRAALLDYQRRFARSGMGAVLDGRDIGTVVCPDAEVKLFVIASPEVRAHRRYLELAAKSPNVSEAAVLADLRERDARDGGRELAPLKPAPDAHLLDTTDLDIEAAFEAARAIVAARL
jgi:cytidylate kinase